MPTVDTTDMKKKINPFPHQARKIHGPVNKYREPNRKTPEAMVELDDGKGETHNSISSLMASLNADDLAFKRFQERFQTLQDQSGSCR